MPVHPPARRRPGVALLLCALLLGACGTSAAGPKPPAAAPAIDPPSHRDDPDAVPEPEADAEGPYEVSVVVDLGPLPDGSGDAVVETTLTVDAAGTRELVVDTPAGRAAHHVMTEDEHWYWLHPGAREAALVDAEWIHFDLREIEAVGGELPEAIVEGRAPLPDPGGIVVGQEVAGLEVVAVEEVGPHEVHLTTAGVERPVVHRRRALPSGTTVRIPEDALDVADLPDVLRW